MNGVVEWELNGIPTGKFSPYAKIKGGKITMVVENGRPLQFNNRSDAKKKAVEFENKLKNVRGKSN